MEFNNLFTKKNSTQINIQYTSDFRPHIWLVIFISNLDRIKLVINSNLDVYTFV